MQKNVYICMYSVPMKILDQHIKTGYTQNIIFFIENEFSLAKWEDRKQKILNSGKRKLFEFCFLLQFA